MAAILLPRGKSKTHFHFAHRTLSNVKMTKRRELNRNMKIWISNLLQCQFFCLCFCLVLCVEWFWMPAILLPVENPVPLCSSNIFQCSTVTSSQKEETEYLRKFTINYQIFYYDALFCALKKTCLVISYLVKNCFKAKKLFDKLWGCLMGMFGALEILFDKQGDI